MFGKLKQNLDGLRAYCKPCEVDWAKEKYEKNIEASRAYAVSKYHANVERSRERGRLAEAIRRTRKAGGGGKHTKKDILRLLQLQRYKCADCRRSVRLAFHVDHIVPVSKGGSSWPWNLQILCPTCNLRKRNRDPVDHANKLGRLL